MSRPSSRRSSTSTDQPTPGARVRVDPLGWIEAGPLLATALHPDRTADMAFQIACGDVMPGCSATFRDETEDGLLEQVVQHVTEEHGITDVTPEMRAQLRGATRQTG